MRTLTVRFLLLALMILALAAPSSAQVRVLVSFGPPALPVYEQPFCPGDDYIWIPGYWAWDGDYDDYYWVPGTWVLAPEPGLYWTPGYWAWGGDGFVFYDGYWGPEVGFYGGIVYGFGYFGRGYEGGRWDHDHFFYNRSVNNVDVTVVHNVYIRQVTNVTVNQISYNGGDGGINARPTPQEETAMHERHIAPVPVQVQHMQAARANPELRASTNRGKPPVAATPRAGAFNDRAVVRAKEAGGAYNPPSKRGDAKAAARRDDSSSRGVPIHPKDLPPIERPAAPNTGNPKLDEKYQQEQEVMIRKQEQARQKLQQQQDMEHQQLNQQQADEARKQQIEQKHQQQTQKLMQRQVQQHEKLQEREQQPPKKHPDGPGESHQ